MKQKRKTYTRNYDVKHFQNRKWWTADIWWCWDLPAYHKFTLFRLSCVIKAFEMWHEVLITCNLENNFGQFGIKFDLWIMWDIWVVWCWDFNLLCVYWIWYLWQVTFEFQERRKFLIFKSFWCPYETSKIENPHPDSQVHQTKQQKSIFDLIFPR